MNHRSGESTIVQVDAVTRDYALGDVKVQALRGITLDIVAGDFLAITGPSGSGKSTLLHLLGGVDVPTSGTVRFLGEDLGKLSADARARLRLHQVGLIFQRFHLLPMLTALENVELPLSAARVGRVERGQRAAELLERVGLADRMRHKPGQLSGGQLQRVAIARALANSPAIILADEPTGELDRTTSHEVLRLFQALNSEGLTIVVATHDLELAEAASRRVQVVDGGIVS